MKKRTMLINGQRAEELRVAIICEGVLDEYQVEMARAGLCKGNVYRGVVTGVHSGLNAAFIKFGGERDGFLAGHDIVPDAYHKKPRQGERYPKVDEVLQKGRSVLVQVTKDPIGSKGAALTTAVSLAGRYLVLTPFDGSVGISRKVDDEARKDIKQKLQKLKLPEGVGCIGRTNAEGQNQRDINRDLNALMRLWKQIRNEAGKGKGPKLLYSDQDLVVSALRDYLDNTIKEVVIDDSALMEKARVFMKTFMPRSRVKLTHYEDRLPLFSRYGLEEQIEAIYKREVPLPSGGAIVIDTTEALTAVDVNSGRFKGRESIEDTAVQTNLEAADEMARQLRLRDIGGLIVVDFIDMRAGKNQRKVVKAVRDAMKADRARNRAERISVNGLMEINRQRIKQALQLQTHRMCPTCRGIGMLPSPDQVGLSLLRRIEARAVAGTIRGANVKLHPELADGVQNRRRREILDIEEEFGVQIRIIAAPGFHRSQEEISWMEGRPEKRGQPSDNLHGAANFGDLLTARTHGKQRGQSKHSQQNRRDGGREKRDQQGRDEGREKRDQQGRNEAREKRDQQGRDEGRDKRDPRERDGGREKRDQQGRDEGRDKRDHRERDGGRDKRDPRERDGGRDKRDPRERDGARDKRDQREREGGRDKRDPRERDGGRDKRDPRERDGGRDKRDQREREGGREKRDPRERDGARERSDSREKSGRSGTGEEPANTEKGREKSDVGRDRVRNQEPGVGGHKQNEEGKAVTADRGSSGKGSSVSKENTGSSSKTSDNKRSSHRYKKYRRSSAGRSSARRVSNRKESEKSPLNNDSTSNNDSSNSK